MNGQASLMEYAILMIVAVMMIFFIVAIIFGWETVTAGAERAQYVESRLLFNAKEFSASAVAANRDYLRGSVFDDSKLTILSGQGGCAMISSMFGEGFYAEISVIFDKTVCEQYRLPAEKRLCEAQIASSEGVECTKDNYPECGTWIICSENKKDRMMYRTLPVNVRRKIDKRTEMAVLKVGVPS